MAIIRRSRVLSVFVLPVASVLWIVRIGSPLAGAESTVPPSITSLSVSSGSVGTAVTITGEGLADVTDVSFGSVPASFTAVSDTRIDTNVPDGALTGVIAVTAPLGSATSLVFTVSPKIDDLVPSSGVPGDTVQIVGSGFAQVVTSYPSCKCEAA